MRKYLSGAAMALVLAVPLSAPGPAVAQTDLTGADNSGAASPAPAPAPVPPPYFGSFEVQVGKGKLIKLPAPVASLYVADPGTATVHPASPTSMFVFGVKAGQTDIVATDQNGNRIAQFTVSVDPSSYYNNRLQGQSQNTAPGNSVIMESEANGVVLQGNVDTAEQADTIVNQAKAISGSGTVINDLTVNEPVQVELKVRIAAMQRNVARELGIDWTAATQIGKFSILASTASLPQELSSLAPGGAAVTFPGGTFEGVIDALATDNLAHILAEPTLTTLSGTQANFQVGGQFPIPTEFGFGEQFQHHGHVQGFRRAAELHSHRVLQWPHRPAGGALHQLAQLGQCRLYRRHRLIGAAGGAWAQHHQRLHHRHPRLRPGHGHRRAARGQHHHCR